MIDSRINIARQLITNNDQVVSVPGSPYKEPDIGHDISLTVNLPRRNLLFTNRENVLEQLDKGFVTTSSKAVIQALCGLSGIGKTQIALEYAHRSVERYKAVLWVNASTSEMLRRDFISIAEQLGLSKKQEQEPKRVIADVKRWLEKEQRWLMILDNVDDVEMIQDFISSAWKGHLLLTTQLRAIQRIAHIINAEPMSLDQGIHFLLRRAKCIPPTVTEEAKSIVKLMGGLPLALDQAGAYIEETSCGLAGYLARFERQQSILLGRRGGLLPEASDAEQPDPAAHPKPVATTWSLSLQKVGEANPAATELLQLCAFLSPDEIPVEMIAAGPSDLGELLGPVAADPPQLESAIEEFARYSLITLTVHKEKTRFLHIHRLVQAVLKNDMDADTRHTWAERTVRVVNRVFPEVEFSTWKLCERYVPHAIACGSLIQEEKIYSLEAARLLHQTAFYLWKRGQYSRVESLYQQALTIQEQVLGPNHPDTAISYHNLALFYRDQGAYGKAEELFKHALEIREQVLEPGHPDIAASLSELGCVYRSQGKYKKAEEPLKEALAIRLQTLDPQHHDVAMSLNDLGWLYRYMGRYEEAQALLEQALEIWERTLKPGDPDMAQALNNLAWVHYDKGRYQEAEALLKRSLKMREHALGHNHPDVAHTLNDLGLLSCVEGKFAQADKFYQRALATREQFLGPEHPDVARTLSNIGLLRYHQQRFAEAEKFYLQALKIRRRVLDADHPDTTQTLNNLARLYHELGRYHEAESLFHESLAIREKALGPEHPHVANCLDSLAQLYQDDGKEEQAERLYLRALDIRERSRGPEHPEVAESLNHLAELYVTQGEYTQAEPLYQRALTIAEKVLMPDHPTLTSILENYADLLWKIGRASEAAEMEKRARAIRASQSLP